MSHFSQTSRSSFTCAFSHDNFTQSYFRIRTVQQQQQDVLTCNWMRKLRAYLFMGPSASRTFQYTRLQSHDTLQSFVVYCRLIYCTRLSTMISDLRDNPEHTVSSIYCTVVPPKFTPKFDQNTKLQYSTVKQICTRYTCSYIEQQTKVHEQ